MLMVLTNLVLFVLLSNKVVDAVYILAMSHVFKGNSCWTPAACRLFVKVANALIDSYCR